jgi:hypothetical protein
LLSALQQAIIRQKGIKGTFCAASDRMAQEVPSDIKKHERFMREAINMVRK